MRLFLIFIISIFASSAFAIRGGEVADITRMPWQISIQTGNGDHFCGGSIVSKTIILTAAHCVTILIGTETYGAEPHQVKILAGNNKLDKLKKLPNVKRVIPHSEFRLNKPNNNDIAVVELEEELILSETISVISLPDFDARSENDIFQYNSNAKFSISGWGAERYWGNHSEYLKVAMVELVASFLDLNYWTEKRISDLYPKSIENVGSNSFYVKSINGKDSACYGDSGGPLVMSLPDEVILIGVLTKTGSLNCDNGFSLYTDVRRYLAWLRSLDLNL